MEAENVIFFSESIKRRQQEKHAQIRKDAKEERKKQR
jgi:hypothetical protein